MRKRILGPVFCGVLAISTGHACADTNIPMLPPTPIGSMAVCPSGTQQILSYSGTLQGGGQSGINCVPITTDAQGNMAASGYIKPGNSTVACSVSLQGAMRYNPASMAFEGCNGTSWQAIGGGLTIIEGGCQTYWSTCPTGYTATSYFSPGTYNCCDKCGNPAWRYTVCSQ